MGDPREDRRQHGEVEVHAGEREEAEHDDHVVQLARHHATRERVGHTHGHFTAFHRDKSVRESSTANDRPPQLHLQQ